MATITGTINNDFLTGTAQDDVIYGDLGDDFMTGGAGNDTFLLKGSAGWDDFNGGDGLQDTILVDQVQPYWNFIAIQIANMSGIEYIKNNSSLPTHIYARYSLDLSNVQLTNISEIRGQATNDAITGNYQDNTILGNDGNDILKGAGGNDALYGGAGADRFDFDTKSGPSSGTDTIYDFQDGVDHIRLDVGATYTTGVDQSGNTYIDTGLNHIILKGVSLSAIDSSDFIFI